MTDREQFEKWITTTTAYTGIERFPSGHRFDGDYIVRTVEIAWQAWQASRATQLVVERTGRLWDEASGDWI